MLKWTDVNFEKNALALTGGDKDAKNHETKPIPMTESLRESL